MEKEISSGTMFGITLIALVSTIGLGFGVYSVAKGVAAESGEDIKFKLSVLNSKVLAATAMSSWLSFFVSKRLTDIHNYFYANRFKIDDTFSTEINIKHIDNKKIFMHQVFWLLFRPVKYKEVEEFTIDNSVDVVLKGKLEKDGNLLLIDDHYLTLNTDLFEYLDTEVTLNLKAAGARQKIERFLTTYEVVAVS